MRRATGTRHFLQLDMDLPLFCLWALPRHPVTLVLLTHAQLPMECTGHEKLGQEIGFKSSWWNPCARPHHPGRRTMEQRESCRRLCRSHDVGVHCTTVLAPTDIHWKVQLLTACRYPAGEIDCLSHGRGWSLWSHWVTLVAFSRFVWKTLCFRLRSDAAKHEITCLKQELVQTREDLSLVDIVMCHVEQT